MKNSIDMREESVKFSQKIFFCHYGLDMRSPYIFGFHFLLLRYRKIFSVTFSVCLYHVTATILLSLSSL